MPRYPEHIRFGGGAANATEVAYRRVPGLYSVALPPGGHEAASGSSRGGGERPLEVLADDTGGSYAVYRGQPKGRGATAPVYSTGAGGPLAVPTGLVFVRLADGAQAEQRRADFHVAGFDVARTLSYAPNAAWLKPRDGDVAGALGKLGALKKVAGVVHVEPQMLSARSLRPPEAPGRPRQSAAARRS